MTLSDQQKQELAIRFQVHPSDIEELIEQGYQIQEHVVLPEQGSTRRNVRSKYRRGLVEKEVVIKFPTEVDPLESINSFINTQVKDINENEARMHREIGFHPRIASIFATIPTQDRRTIVIEPVEESGRDLVAPSLKREVQRHGPIKDIERTKRFIDQFLDPCLFLAEKSIVHRDIKPTNVLMTDEGPVITDCQNATKSYWISSKYYPSKGGTSFSAPDLINTIIRGEIGKYREQHEVYSVGATILYGLTGEEFGYHLDLDPEGTNPNSKLLKVSIKDSEKTFWIKLTRQGEDLEEITEKEHEKRTRAIIAKLTPQQKRRYGKTLERCLIPWHKKAIRDRFELKNVFDKINASTYVRAKERFIEGSKWVLPTLTGVGIGGTLAATIVLGIIYNPPQTPPTVREMLDPRNRYGTFALEDLSEHDKEYVYSVLVPYMKKAQERFEKLFNEETEKDIQREVHGFFNQIHRMDKRLTSAWLRACYLNRNLVERYGRNKLGETNRTDLTFVPRDFVRSNNRTAMVGRDYLDDRLKLYHGITYLKLCLGPERTAEETLVDYFTNSVDKNTAIARTGSPSYLPRVEDHAIKSGFHSHLPYHQRELINTALALYMITDDEGKVHYDWIPRIIPKATMGALQSATVLEDVHEKRKQTSIAPVEK